MKPLCIYHEEGVTVADAAYLAGLIDGEGCVSVTRTNTSKSAKGCTRGYSYRASICIAMTDRPLLAWAHEITDLGSIVAKKVTNESHRPAWVWQVWSNEAASLANIVLPFLRLKKPQAVELIRFQSAMRLPGSKGLTDQEWANREATYNQFRLMNFRGVQQ